MTNRSGPGNNKRILLPYFLAGSGHLVSAMAISAFLRRKRPNWTMRLLEPADEFESEELDRLFRRSWQLVLSKPKLATAGFALLDTVLPAIPLAVNSRIVRREATAARQVIEGFAPDLVVTTHWGCGHIFQAVRTKFGLQFPLFLVRNDLGGAFRLQDCGCDLTFVTSDAAKRAFVEIGVPEERLRQVNLLVRPEFLPQTTSKQESRRRLNIDESETVVLLSAGGEGVGDLEAYMKETLEVFAEANAPVRLLVLTGRNVELFERITASNTDRRATILPYRDDIDQLMRSADIVVGKCGANYTMESIMLRRFFVVTQVGAPSERFNMEYVVENGLGWYAPKPAQYRRLLQKYLANDPEIDAVRRRLAAIETVSGAEQIADAIINHLE